MHFGRCAPKRTASLPDRTRQELSAAFTGSAICSPAGGMAPRALKTCDTWGAPPTQPGAVGAVVESEPFPPESVYQPQILEGVRGWGAKRELDLSLINKLG